MKCAKCGEELNERWAVCPFCGTEVPKTPLSVSDALKDIVDHYGPSIFREENCVRLERLMSDWPDTLADDRDIIKLLQIKNIPDRLSSALEMPEAERLPVVQQSTSLLSDKFGINGESAIKMISLVTDAIGLKVEGVVAGSGNGTFTDPRDGHVYKTCKIGDQIWMAENLKFDAGDEVCCPYDNDYRYFDDYGYLYSKEIFRKENAVAPEGWHLPTEDDFNTLIKNLKRTYKCKDPAKQMISQRNGEKFGSEYGVSGFEALLGGYGESFGGWQVGLSSEFRYIGEGAYFLGNNSGLAICYTWIPSGVYDWTVSVSDLMAHMASIRLVKD